MSDNTTPNKPTPQRINHLQAEPVPISFISPQQLASITTGGFLNNPSMKTTMPSFMPPMNPGFTMMNSPTYQPKTQQPISPSEASASASPKPASSNSNFLTSLPPQDLDLSKFDGHKFIMLDQYQLDPREIYEEISKSNSWVMCEDADERCISVIQEDCSKKRVFLVSAGGLGMKTVPQIHNLPQVYAIYVYCTDVKGHRKWADNYSKVRVVCDNDDRDLLPQFAVDLAQSNIEWGNALLKAGDKEKAKKKFEAAQEQLNNPIHKKYQPPRKHDPAMDAEIQKKLEECK